MQQELQATVIPRYLAVLAPNRFDNAVFWRLVYQRGLESQVNKSLEQLCFGVVTEGDSCVYYSPSPQSLRGSSFLDVPDMIEIIVAASLCQDSKPHIRDYFTSSDRAAPEDFVFRAVLHPDKFDNYLFWTRVGEAKLLSSCEESINELRFEEVTHYLTHTIVSPYLKTLNQTRFINIPGIIDIIVSCSRMTVVANVFLRRALDGYRDPSQELGINLSSRYYHHLNVNGVLGKDMHLGLCTGISLNPKDTAQTNSASLDLRILGGFIAALGAAAVIAALTVLNITSLGSVVAVVGMATTLVGCGLFKKGYDDQQNTMHPVSVATSP